jgi:hypothetical protein
MPIYGMAQDKAVIGEGVGIPGLTGVGESRILQDYSLPATLEIRIGKPVSARQQSDFQQHAIVTLVILDMEQPLLGQSAGCRHEIKLDMKTSGPRKRHPGEQEAIRAAIEQYGRPLVIHPGAS